MTRPPDASPAGTYRLHDLGLALTSDDATLGRAADRLLRLLRATPSQSTPSLRLGLRLTRTPGTLPEDAARIDTHARGVEVFEAPPHVYLRYGSSLVTLAPATGTATFHLGAELDDERRLPVLLFDFLVLSLLILLRPHGHYLLHAACVVYRDTGVLLSAHSRSGKSTLATALVAAGWAYLSDDLLLLRQDAGGVQALGLGTHFRLLPDALTRFPALVPSSSAPPRDKHLLDVDTLFPGQYLPHCRPGVLLIPEITDQPSSELLPLPPSAALLHMLGQTSFLSRDTPLADRHLSTLKALAFQVKTFRLKAGRDLYHDPARTAALLAPLCTPPPA